MKLHAIAAGSQTIKYKEEGSILYVYLLYY
jgi:hypothetical protein